MFSKYISPSPTQQVILGYSKTAIHLILRKRLNPSSPSFSVYSASGHPFDNITVLDKSYNSDRLRNPLIPPQQMSLDGVLQIAPDRIGEFVAHARVIHLRVPMNEAQRYLSLILSKAKRGTLIFTPWAQFPSFSSKLESQGLVWVGSDIFEGIVSQKKGTSTFTLCAQKFTNPIVARNSSDFLKALPHLATDFPGGLVPIFDLTPYFNGGNRSYHPFIHLWRLVHAMKSDFPELDGYVKSQKYPEAFCFLAQKIKEQAVSNYKVEDNCFYIDAPPDIDHLLVQVGHENLLAKAALKAALYKGFPDKYQAIIQEYERLYTALASRGELDLLHPEAKTALSQGGKSYMAWCDHWTNAYPGPKMIEHYRHTLEEDIPPAPDKPDEHYALQMTTLWRTNPKVYGFTPAPQNPDGSFDLGSRFIMEDCAQILRELIFASVAGINATSQLPLHTSIIRCFEAITSCTYLKDEVFTTAAHDIGTFGENITSKRRLSALLLPIIRSDKVVSKL